MFHDGKFNHTEVPGCFLIPYNFDVNLFQEYVKTNIHECRQIAKKYIQKQKLLEQKDSLHKSQTQLWFKFIMKIYHSILL